MLRLLNEYARCMSSIGTKYRATLVAAFISAISVEMSVRASVAAIAGTVASWSWHANLIAVSFPRRDSESAR